MDANALIKYSDPVGSLVNLENGCFYRFIVSAYIKYGPILSTVAEGNSLAVKFCKIGGGKVYLAPIAPGTTKPVRKLQRMGHNAGLTALVYW